MKQINRTIIIGFLLTCLNAYSMKTLSKFPKKNIPGKRLRQSPKKTRCPFALGEKKGTQYSAEIRRLNDQHEVVFRHYKSSAGLFEGDPE